MGLLKPGKRTADPSDFTLNFFTIPLRCPQRNAPTAGTSAFLAECVQGASPGPQAYFTS
jgi:hypothetical protein